MNFLLRSRLVVFLFGFLGFIVSERYLSHESYHYYVLGGAALFMAIGILTPILGGMRAKQKGFNGEARSWLYVFSWKLSVFAGCGLFLVYDHLMGNSAVPDTLLEKGLLAGWLLLIVLGVFAGVGVETSHSYSGTGERAEAKRVSRSAVSWLMAGMVFAILACFNYAVVKRDKAWDWSYLKTTAPSESTINMFVSTDKVVEIAVFYPNDNEVLPFVKEYFSFLGSKVKNTDLNFYDIDIFPTKAEDFKASKNGQVVFRLDGKRERIDIGLDIKSARSSLKKMDAEVQKVFLRMAAEKKKIYFTRGHGEMSWTGKKDPMRSLDVFEKILRSQNYSLRFLGVAEGSANKVPEDAAAVVIAGPTEPFLQAEADALRAYINRGGAVAAFLDVAKSMHDSGNLGFTGKDPLVTMLKEAGIEFVQQRLANEKNYVSATRSPSDKWFLFSNSFSTHESVSSLARNEERVALILLQTGYFNVAERTGEWKGYTTVRSMGGTFPDLNNNFQKDPSEKEVSFSIGAAAEKKVKYKDEGGKETEGVARVFALGDANALADALLRNRGNAVFALDSMKWLAGQSEFAGEVNSEEDIKIRHTNKEDAIWFNATVVVMPLLVLMFGFFATRSRRRKGKES